MPAPKGEIPVEIQQQMDEIGRGLLSAVEFGEGRSWIEYVGMLSALAGSIERLLDRPDAVHPATRLPVSPATLERRVQDFAIPDTAEGAEPKDGWLS